MTKPTRKEENKLYRRGIQRIAGVDEAGRGAWAGPLVAAAVILPRRCRISGLNDSKKLAPRARERLYKEIINCAIAVGVCTISSREIDRYGVGVANRRAIVCSVNKLAPEPQFVLVDGFQISWRSIPSLGIPGGDAKVVSIAAASIIAKVTRDRLMVSYHRRHPRYQFDEHKGYGTAVHRQRIIRHGVCPLHRRSFNPIRSMGV